MKICNILKNINCCFIMAALIILCLFVFMRPVTVEAAESQTIPMLPDAVIGYDYILYEARPNKVCLVIIKKDIDGLYFYSYEDSGLEYSQIMVSESVGSDYVDMYTYYGQDGWTKASSGAAVGWHNLYEMEGYSILSSTFALYDFVDNSKVRFAKNANVIHSNQPFIDDFSTLLLGSVGVFDSNFLGIMPFACMVCAAVFMFIYRMGGRGF